MKNKHAIENKKNIQNYKEKYYEELYNGLLIPKNYLDIAKNM
jgi:hypothetical protein